ncbi:MAG: DUF4440 domain-containing protein [Acidimicrobiia bacterium]|nr:DUF4440 domain-containing protein [Acidimicrobiia bacterium]
MLEDRDCFDEVARLHRFFQDWFRGDLDRADFAICEEALAPGFAMVTPGGDHIDRDAILEAIRRHRAREAKSFTIETVGRGYQHVNGVHLVTYEERQAGARSSIRLSTAALTRNGPKYLWHLVHETWVTV